MDRRVRSLRCFSSIGLALTCALACDKPREGEAASNADAQPSEPAKAPAESSPANATPPDAEPGPVPAEPEPEAPPTVTIASLAASVARSDDPSTAAWTHYKAKDYAAALPYFAQATLAEPGPWKHPYNLACAAALAGDEAVAKLGLQAAVTRDREAVANKARKDTDLASIRDNAWFEPTLQGAPSDAPTPSEPSTPTSPATALEKAQLTQLVAKLEAKHGVKVEVRSSLAQPGAAGETLAWALYSLGRKDVCRKTASEQECEKQLHTDPDMGEYDQTKCNHEYLVHARFGAELSLGEPGSLQLPCKLAKIRQFEATDVDADGKPEIVVDVVGRQNSFGVHETDVIYGGRELRILRLDDTKQFELTVAWTVADVVPNYERSQTYELVDENADGHPDLLIETMEFMGLTDVLFDEAMWVRTDIEQDEELVGPHSSKLRYYDADKDEWGPELDGRAGYMEGP